MPVLVLFYILGVPPELAKMSEKQLVIENIYDLFYLTNLKPNI